MGNCYKACIKNYVDCTFRIYSNTFNDFNLTCTVGFNSYINYIPVQCLLYDNILYDNFFFGLLCAKHLIFNTVL